MNKSVSLAELAPLIREQTAAGGEAVITVNGISMTPLLRNGADCVALVAPSLPLKKYDIPLYRRPDGAFVLHRVVAVKPDGYVCRGDGQTENERNVTDDMIVALASARIRGGERRDLYDRGMRVYAFFRVNTAFLRRLPFWFRARVLRK